MEQRLDKKDIYLIVTCLVITVVCLAVGIPFFYQAFPEASIDFKITRDQARDQAAAFLAESGLDTGDYRHSAVFQYDGNAKTFLERELGLEGANQVIGHPVRLWRWSNRWVRELQKEEFQVEVTTTGELVAFRHLIEENREGARLSEIEARYLAEQFLIDALQRPISSLEFVESEAVERENRTDYTFTWKLIDFEVSEATYRLQVNLQGDQIGGFREFLKIPEAWTRDYEELRSHNMVTGLIASFFLLLTLLAMLVVFFIAVRQQDIRWKTAAVFGGIAFVLTFLAQLNNLPVTEYGYLTTDTYGSFLTKELLYSLLTALGQGIFILFLTAAAEPVYRRAYGGQIRIGEQFQPHGMRTKRFLIGTIIGLALTAFFFAYQTLFYLVAEKFGAWSPAQIPYDEMVNTYIPWVWVLLIGFLPAVSEEFISRAFSIPFLHKYLKSRWAAVFVSAIIWGFAHATYPQQPFFIRGLEVGIAGIIVGFVMLRWGILAPLIWHYTIDALYTALILLRSSNDYFVISAALSAGLMLLPLIVAVLLYLRRRYFVDPASMLNQADSPPLTRTEVPSPRDTSPEAQLLRELPVSVLATYRPLSWRHLAVAVVLIAASLSVFLKEAKGPLEFIDYAITGEQAEKRATEHLRTLGVDPDTFRVVTYQQHQPDAGAIKYILEREDIAWVDRIYQRDLRASLWMTRFFRPEQKREFLIAVDPENGSIYSARHLLAEDAPGADIEEDQARKIAEDYMRQHGLAPADFELEESSSEKLKARRDHRFVWKARGDDPRSLEELEYRVEVKIAGERPILLLRHFKLPEAWRRDREESSTLQATLNGLRIALIVALTLHMLWLLIRQVRGEGITWSPLLKIGALAAALFLLDFLNSLPVLDRAYDTLLNLAIYTVIRVVGGVILLIGVSLMVIGGLGLMSTLYPDWQTHLRRTARSSELRDACFVTALVLIARESFSHLLTMVKQQFAAHLLSPTPSLISDLDVWWPFLNGLSSSLASALGLPVAAGIVVYYVRRVLKSPPYAILAILALALLNAGADARDPGEFGLALALFLLQVIFVYLVVAFLLRNNLLAYILVGFLASGLTHAKNLLLLSAPAFRYHGYALLLFVVLFVLFFLIYLRKRPSSEL